MADIECEHCGGTDFYKEAGFFFCKGCQIQSQEVQEVAFEEYTEDKRLQTQRIQTTQKDKSADKITSWECYNYILLGLTEELINLGADRKLKTVVKSLWLCYLEKMRVFKIGGDQMPKLQAVSSGKDGEIVYGKLAKTKRKRRQSSSSDATSMDSSALQRERGRRKRALVKAQYEDFSQKSQATSSLHNETLTSLKTPSEKSSKHSVSIKYNIFAAKEMRRFQKSKYHFHKHGVDFEHALKCHKMSYRKVSHRYRTGPYILSLNKIYSILYIALLILKDKIQVSDMLRFIREGKLSFNCYSHFFPEDFETKDLNFRNFKKNGVFVNARLRAITLEMSIFLQVQYYITCPNLVELSERYCRELNLPNDICKCVKNILSRTEVKMSFRRRLFKIPNYEGRVLSIILFVIKLLFGLDDMTEFHLGKYADILNQSAVFHLKMFNVIEWLKHIEYRNLAMIEEHFPTNFTQQSDANNVELTVGQLSKKEYPELRFHETKDTVKHLLTKLKDVMYDPVDKDFPVTLTPFADYVKLLPKTKYFDILTRSFTNDGLNHILKPSQFLEMINEDLEIVHGGANENWVVEKLACFRKQLKHNRKEKRKLVTVKLSLGETKSRTRERAPVINSEAIKSTFNAANEERFKEEEVRNKQRNNCTNFDVEKLRKHVCGEDYLKHYNPHRKFWMRTKFWPEAASQKECGKFLEKFPSNFQLVFKECQRIAQQSEQELLSEYQMTELYLVYFANYGKKFNKQEIDNLIVNHLNKFVDLW